MKKLRLKKNKKQTPDEQPQSRITNETVAEHRERILAGGRRFKYPHQYVKHKLVINALLITAGVIIVAALVGWWQLYIVQNTSDFMYRITRVLPVPVANVDGASIRYSDYLVQYRSQEQWLRSTGQLGLAGDDSQRQLDYLKAQTLDKLVADIYAQKRANELGIKVTEEEVQAVVDKNRKTQNGKTSQEVYDASIRDVLGYAPDEYRRLIRQAMVRQKVAYAVDTEAKSYADQVAKLIKQKRPKLNFEQIVERFKKQGVDLEFGAPGPVPRNNQDGGLSETALELKDGQVSSVIKSTNGDGYYFVQRLSGNSSQINYQYIKIPLTVFADKVVELKKNDKVEYYISIPETAQVKQ